MTSKPDEPMAIIARLVRARSAENRNALLLLRQGKYLSQEVAILRQELDSMVRVMYLLSIQDRTRRGELVRSLVQGDVWRRETGKGRITDKEMVELANGLEGWAESVYKFGCAFIHLSAFHDYGTRNPFESLSASEIESIRLHVKGYHFIDIGPNPAINDLEPVMYSIFVKISGNLKCYLKMLEEDRDLDERRTQRS